MREWKDEKGSSKKQFSDLRRESIRGTDIKNTRWGKRRFVKGSSVRRKWYAQLHGQKGTVDVPTQRGINLNVPGCLYRHVFLALSQQASKPTGIKKRKIVGKKGGRPHGTTTIHFLLLVAEIVAPLERLGLHNMITVPDNASIVDNRTDKNDE